LANRIKAFDVAKFVAILAVIVGHTAIRFSTMSASATKAVALAFTFHLPVFLVVSGYFLHEDRPFRWGKEARSLIEPYVIGAVAIVLVTGAANAVLHDQGSTLQVFKDWTSAAIYGAGDIAAEDLAVWPQVYRIGGLWFLLALFWARFVTCAAFKTKAPVLVVTAAFIVGIFSSKIVFLPFDIQSGLCASAFVAVGVYARKFRLFERGGVHPVMWVLLAVVWVWAILAYDGYSMAMCGYGDTFMAFSRNICGAIAGSFCVIGACCALERGRVGESALWNVLAKLGTMTLMILCVHIFEDDVLRWGLIVEASLKISTRFSWAFVALVRCAVDVVAAVIFCAAASRFRGFVGHLNEKVSR
jgi:fucose 4-O-acetylase-like acetyltransferase